jgi:hypothetical protein
MGKMILAANKKNEEIMTNRLKLYLNLFILITILSMVIGCYTTSSSPKEVEKNVENLSYAINSGTILESLKSGKTDVFAQPTINQQVTTSQHAESVSWHQADYFFIAKALYQQTQQATLGVQNLYAMSFNMNCAETNQGTFSDGTFSSFKVIEVGENEIRVEYIILIQPLENSINTYKSEFHPNINSKKPINLLQYRISVEDALQIAEKNGGSLSRLKYSNNCKIYAHAPASDDTGWEISYSINQQGFWQSIFDITIDSQTGTYKISYP